MPDQYRTTSTSAQSFEVEIRNPDGTYTRDIELEASTTGQTRKVLRALIVRNATAPDQRAKIVLLHQRKLPNGQWEDISAINLASLRGGDGVKLDLHTTPTYKLYQQLKQIYEIAESGEVGYGVHDLIVGQADEMVRVDPSRAVVIRSLIDAGHSEEVWTALAGSDPDLATRLSLSKIQENRIAKLSQFETMLRETHTEEEWQSFFETNKWIFGYGLKYVFLNAVTGQPQYGGTRVTGEGGQRGDFLQSTIAEVSFTVLTEIKRPDTLLVLEAHNRAGCNKLSPELLDAVNQLQVNSHTWETQGATTTDNHEALDDHGIHTIRPKGILIIGNTAQLTTLDKQRAFETFRSSLNYPEIITFDELHNRAKFIVESQ